MSAYANQHTEARLNGLIRCRKRSAIGSERLGVMLRHVDDVTRTGEIMPTSEVRFSYRLGKG